MCAHTGLCMSYMHAGVYPTNEQTQAHKTQRYRQSQCLYRCVSSLYVCIAVFHVPASVSVPQTVSMLYLGHREASRHKHTPTHTHKHKGTERERGRKREGCVSLYRLGPAPVSTCHRMCSRRPPSRSANFLIKNALPYITRASSLLAALQAPELRQHIAL